MKMWKLVLGVAFGVCLGGVFFVTCIAVIAADAPTTKTIATSAPGTKQEAICAAWVTVAGATDCTVDHGRNRLNITWEGATSDEAEEMCEVQKRQLGGSGRRWAALVANEWGRELAYCYFRI